MRNHQSLNFAIEKVYKKCGFEFSGLTFEMETNQYEACEFFLNEKRVIYRTAKITPKKIGQFVAIWKRNNLGITIPYHNIDDFDLLIISTKTADHFGQFIFSKNALYKNGLISTDVKEGKRGVRLYPAWDKVVNKQAIHTQEWQSKYFINFSELEEINFNKVKSLLNSM